MSPANKVQAIHDHCPYRADRDRLCDALEALADKQGASAERLARIEQRLDDLAERKPSNVDRYLPAGVAAIVAIIISVLTGQPLQLPQ